MPLLTSSTFKSRFYLPSGHLQSIYPSVFRKSETKIYQRERIFLPDNDFLDLDWLPNNSQKLVILSHGLEGNTHRPYMTGMSKAFVEAGWDVLAWNCRSCSGELNRLPRLYYHGDTDDISHVVNYALQKKNYESIVLIGFSMGGSIALNYLGKRNDIPVQVKTAIGFSMPSELGTTVAKLKWKQNYIYFKLFLDGLGGKVMQKAALFPQIFDLSHYSKIKTWEDFDRHYTAPLYGYKSVEELYYDSSSNYILDKIKVPFLMCNAKNDPILSAESSPYKLAEELPNFHLETPDTGGHVGFYPFKNTRSWMEHRALNWVTSLGL